MSTLPRLPKMETLEPYVEVRRGPGFPDRWEARVVRRQRWRYTSGDLSEWSTVHVGPSHPNRPDATVFISGGIAYWFAGLRRDRVIAKAERWLAAAQAERARLESARRA